MQKGEGASVRKRDGGGGGGGGGGRRMLAAERESLRPQKTALSKIQATQLAL